MLTNDEHLTTKYVNTAYATTNYDNVNTDTHYTAIYVSSPEHGLRKIMPFKN